MNQRKAISDFQDLAWFLLQDSNFIIAQVTHDLFDEYFFVITFYRIYINRKNKKGFVVFSVCILSIFKLGFCVKWRYFIPARKLSKFWTMVFSSFEHKNKIKVNSKNQTLFSGSVFLVITAQKRIKVRFANSKVYFGCDVELVMIPKLMRIKKIWKDLKV